MSKRALIFGVNGMDGSHLADLLLEKGYEVYGTVRHSSVDGHLRRIGHCLDHIRLLRADLIDAASVRAAICAASPDEVYNEADQDNVGWSHSIPEYAHQVTAGGPLRILEALRTTRYDAKFFQPLSSTMFGNPWMFPQTKETPLEPRSPYAAAKCAAKYWCEYYRRVHGMFVSCAIFYTHTSERQHGDYLMHKIARYAAKVADPDRFGKLKLGNPDQLVDIGYAPDFMEVAWLMMQEDEPTTELVGTGSARYIGKLVQRALDRAGTGLTTEDVLGRDDAYWTDDPSTLSSHMPLKYMSIDHMDAYRVVVRLVDHYLEKT